MKQPEGTSNMAKPAFNPKLPFEVLDKKPAFDPSKPFEILDQPQAAEPTGLEQFETAGRSALEGMSLGASEPVISGINAVVGNLIDAGFDAESIGEFAKKAVSGEAIKQQYEKDIARRKSLEAALPGTAMTAEIAGGLLSPANKAIGTIARTAASVVPTQLGKAIATGAVAAGGTEALKAGIQVPTGTALPEEFDIEKAAALGGKLGGAFYGVGKAISSIPEVVPKVLSTLGGVNVETIQQYLKDPGAVFRAKSPAEIKVLIDNQVDKLSEAIEKNQIDLDDARVAFDTAKTALRDTVASRKLEFQNAKFNAQQTLDRAQEKFDSALRTAKDVAEKSLDRNKIIFRDEVVDAVEQLKRKVDQGSAESYRILERSKTPIDFSTARDAIKEAMEGLKVNGKVPNLPGVQEEFKLIENTYNDLKRFKKPLLATEAKRYVQLLDSSTRYAETQSEYGTKAENALKAARAAIDAQLKDNPEYQKVMQEVSENAALRSKAAKLFGTAEKANPKIATITADNRDLERQVLSALGQKVGKPFEQKINELQKVEGTLEKGVMKGMLSEEDIGLKLARAEKEAEAFKTPGLLQKQISAIETESPQALALKQQSERVQQTQDLMQSSREKLRELGPFGRPLSNISAIGTVLNERNPEYDKYLKNLTQLSGQDFNQLINDLRLAQQFNKEFKIGSRNVNLWAIGSGATHFAFTGDPITAMMSSGLGATFGALVDRFGPKMTQAVLDRYLKIKGAPTIQKIDQVFSDLPKEITQQLKNDFIRTFPVASDEQVQVKPNEKPQLIEDIKNSNLSTLKKAKLLYNLNKKSEIYSNDLASIMFNRKENKPKQLGMPLPKSDLKIDKPDVLKSLQRMQETR